MIFWWLSFFSQQWKHQTTSLFIKCLVSIFALSSTIIFIYGHCGLWLQQSVFKSRKELFLHWGWKRICRSFIQYSLRNVYFLHIINVPRNILASHIIIIMVIILFLPRKIQASDMVFWFLSFCSQQWKLPTSYLFIKCLVNIFELTTTYRFV